MLFIHSASESPLWYPTVSIPSLMVTHSSQPLLHSARMYWTSAFLWLLDISTTCQRQDNDFPQKTILRQPIGSVLSICLPLSVNDKWQPQADGNKSFFKSKLIPEEETYTHTHKTLRSTGSWRITTSRDRRRNLGTSSKWHLEQNHLLVLKETSQCNMTSGARKH